MYIYEDKSQYIFFFFQSMVTLANVCSFGDIWGKLGLGRENAWHISETSPESFSRRFQGYSVSLSLGAQSPTPKNKTCS